MVYNCNGMLISTLDAVHVCIFRSVWVLFPTSIVSYMYRVERDRFGCEMSEICERNSGTSTFRSRAATKR